MEIHNQDESREERYLQKMIKFQMVILDELFDQAMRENEEIASRTPNETLDELERDGSDAW